MWITVLCIGTFLSKCRSSLMSASVSPPGHTAVVRPSVSNPKPTAHVKFMVFCTHRAVSSHIHVWEILPSSSRDGTPNMSSWSSLMGVAHFLITSAVIVSAGSSTASMWLMRPWKRLYVRGGWPPLSSMILSIKTEEYLWEKLIKNLTVVLCYQYSLVQTVECVWDSHH